MASSRQLKTKIRSVKNIRQITRAMQMVAATKMRKAQEAALRARPFAQDVFSLLLHLKQYATAEQMTSVFWNKEGTTGKVLLVVVTSDKGLAGSFNGAVLRTALEWKEQEEKNGTTVEVVAVGKRGRDFFKTRNTNIPAEFFRFSDIFTLYDALPMIQWVLNAYRTGEYDRVAVCYTQFVSALVQKPSLRTILPVDKKEIREIVAHIALRERRERTENTAPFPYVFDPSVREILDELVEDLVKSSLVHLLFESNASEHSARMVAMKNATENAKQVGEMLTLQLNKSRQAAITQEIGEIATAKEALATE